MGLVVLDGLHAIFKEEIKELREALESQKVIVRRSQSGEAMARTRVVGCMNPKARKPMKNYLYKCLALSESQLFADPPEITRWDLFLPFGDGDVPKSEITRHERKDRSIYPGRFLFAMLCGRGVGGLSKSFIVMVQRKLLRMRRRG